jgi:hypothetical protein
MGMSLLQKALQNISRSNDSDFEGEKDEKLVRKAESFLGITFPPTYREFLLKLGCGNIKGIEIYGLIDDNFTISTIPNAIWLTYVERNKFNLPPYLILIGQSQEGYYALDTSRNNADGEAPVIDWHNGLDPKKAEIVAEDFGEFLINIVK